MRYIDCFNHFFPPALWERLAQLPGKDITKRMRGVPAIYDLDRRLAIINQFREQNDYSQVISLGMPPLELLGPPDLSLELAKLANDGMAELCAKHPQQFDAYLASLPMNDPNLAAREAERAFGDGHCVGLQIHTNIAGVPLDDPRFRPIFEVAAKTGKPIFLHPARSADSPDYKSESKSKYEIWWTFGWPYETAAAMARLVFSGVVDEFPDLKILTHHLGAIVPALEGRVGPGQDQLGSRTSDEDLTLVLKRLKKRPIEYFKDFYADTATFGSRAGMVCGLEFFKRDRVLFASDCPFDPEQGTGFIRETIKVLESLDLSTEDREKICFRNAQKLFGLASS